MATGNLSKKGYHMQKQEFDIKRKKPKDVDCAIVMSHPDDRRRNEIQSVQPYTETEMS